MVGSQPRLSDPGIASVIFAPVPCNYTPSAVTTSAGLTAAFAFEWPTDEEKELFSYALRNRWRDVVEIQRLIAALLGQGLETVTGIVATIPCASKVPAREFPFIRHLDLLALPIVEGMIFDVEDFAE